MSYTITLLLVYFSIWLAKLRVCLWSLPFVTKMRENRWLLKLLCNIHNLVWHPTLCVTGPCLLLLYSVHHLMNGPQRTAVSRKELWQKWKQTEFLIIYELVRFDRDTARAYSAVIISRVRPSSLLRSRVKTPEQLMKTKISSDLHRHYIRFWDAP